MSITLSLVEGFNDFEDVALHEAPVEGFDSVPVVDKLDLNHKKQVLNFGLQLVDRGYLVSSDSLVYLGEEFLLNAVIDLLV